LIPKLYLQFRLLFSDDDNGSTVDDCKYSLRTRLLYAVQLFT